MSDNKEKQKQQQQQASVTIDAQYIKDLSLEIPLAPQIFKELKETPRVDVNVETRANELEQGVFNVDLKMELKGMIKEKPLFILELTYSAVVGINVPKEHEEPVLLIEVPRLMFPFARSIITNGLVDAGLPPFMISPIDFAAMYSKKKQAN